VVVGAVSSTPVVLTDENRGREAGKLPEELIDEMARRAAEAVDPADDLRGPAAYKRRLVSVLVRRALDACLNQRESG
jgi:carbon-monoxide dehydrogenase medium subunit